MYSVYMSNILTTFNIKLDKDDLKRTLFALPFAKFPVKMSLVYCQFIFWLVVRFQRSFKMLARLFAFRLN